MNLFLFEITRKYCTPMEKYQFKVNIKVTEPTSLGVALVSLLVTLRRYLPIETIEDDTVLISSLLALNKFNFFWGLWTSFGLIRNNHHKLRRKIAFFENLDKHPRKPQNFSNIAETYKIRVHFQKRCLKSARTLNLNSLRRAYQEFYEDFLYGYFLEQICKLLLKVMVKELHNYYQDLLSKLKCS